MNRQPMTHRLALAVLAALATVCTFALAVVLPAGPAVGMA